MLAIAFLPLSVLLGSEGRCSANGMVRSAQVSVCVDVLDLGLVLGAAQVIAKFCLDAAQVIVVLASAMRPLRVEAELNNDLRCAEVKAEAKDVKAKTDRGCCCCHIACIMCASK